MLTTRTFKCPSCGSDAKRKYVVKRRDRQMLYFGCQRDSCRNHFQVLDLDGFNPQIVAESKLGDERLPVDRRKFKEGAEFNMYCPQCGRYGGVRMTHNRIDGYWRRHECATCGPYYTCETTIGVTAHQTMKPLAEV